jgi:type I restriction enzyme S subunit
MEKLQPKLRFPEFEGDWVFDKIGDYIDLFSGIALKGDEISDDNTGIPILRGINITEGYIRHSKEIDKYYLGAINKITKYYVKENDLVLGMDGSKVGKNVALITKKDENSILIQRVARIRATEKSNINYLYQQIFSKSFTDYVDVVNTSSGIPHISSQQIKDFTIGFPSIEEQTKIATFLSSVDEKLNFLKEKKTLLEEYKKGMMQQIFSQQLRFKDEDGKDFEDWEEKTLGDVGEVINGLTYSPDNICVDGILVLRSSNIKDRRLVFTDNVYVDSEKFNPVFENDILICVRNGSRNLIGKNVIIPKEIQGVAFGAFMTVYRSKFNKFLIHWFDSEDYKQNVNINLGATINSINGSDLKKFVIPVPSMNEQIKIANFLSAIDEKITTVAEVLEATQEYKRGLLQGMFC